MARSRGPHRGGQLLQRSPPLVAITAFEARSVWLGMHNQADVLEVWLPPLDFQTRGAGADLVEWCNTCRLCEEEAE